MLKRALMYFVIFIIADILCVGRYKRPL